jgi:hypothetical protein
MLYCPSNTNEYTQISDGANTNCCSKKYDVNAEAIKNSKDQTICCVDGATTVPSKYNNYAAPDSIISNPTELIPICKPNENITGKNAKLAFSTGTSDYYCVYTGSLGDDNSITSNGTTLTCNDGVWTVVKRTEQTYTTPTNNTKTGVQNFFYGVTDENGNISNNNGLMIGTPNEDTHKKTDTTPE